MQLFLRLNDDALGPKTINVIVGERYKEVTDQVIQYALGIWGKEAPEIMAPDVKDRILNRSRANDWRGWTAPDLSLHEVRQKYGATISDEELLLRVYAGTDAVDALLANGAPRQQLDARRSLLQLIEELSKKKDCNQVYIRRSGFSLRMGKSADAGLSSSHRGQFTVTCFSTMCCRALLPVISGIVEKCFSPIRKRINRF